MKIRLWSADTPRHRLFRGILGPATFTGPTIISQSTAAHATAMDGWRQSVWRVGKNFILIAKRFAKEDKYVRDAGAEYKMIREIRCCDLNFRYEDLNKALFDKVVAFSYSSGSGLGGPGAIIMLIRDGIMVS